MVQRVTSTTLDLNDTVKLEQKHATDDFDDAGFSHPKWRKISLQALDGASYRSGFADLGLAACLQVHNCNKTQLAAFVPRTCYGLGYSPGGHPHCSRTGTCQLTKAALLLQHLAIATPRRCS
jgi:hypothetical protein